MLSDEQVAKEYARNVVTSIQNECKKMPIQDQSEGPNRSLVVENANHIKKLKENHDKQNSLAQSVEQGNRNYQDLKAQEKVLNSTMRKAISRLDRVKMVKTAMLEELFSTAQKMSTSFDFGFVGDIGSDEEKILTKFQETANRIDTRETEFVRVMQEVRKKYNRYCEIKKKVEALPKIEIMNSRIQLLEEEIRKFDANLDNLSETMISDHADLNSSHYVEYM